MKNSIVTGVHIEQLLNCCFLLIRHQCSFKKERKRQDEEPTKVNQQTLNVNLSRISLISIKTLSQMEKFGHENKCVRTSVDQLFMWLLLIFSVSVL